MLSSTEAPLQLPPTPKFRGRKEGIWERRKVERRRRGGERARVCSGARRGALMGAKAAPAGPCWRWGGARLRCCLSAQRYRGDDGGARAGAVWAAQRAWVVGGPEGLPPHGAVGFIFLFPFFLNPFSFLIFVENRKGEKEKGFEGL